MIETNHKIVVEDRRLGGIGISTKPMHNILNERLCIKKLSAKWVLRLFRLGQKVNRITTYIENLALYERNPILWMKRFY